MPTSISLISFVPNNAAKVFLNPCKAPELPKSPNCVIAEYGLAIVHI